MNRSTWAALVVALMLGSGIAGYLIGSPATPSIEHRRRREPPQTTPPLPAPHRPSGPAGSAARRSRRRPRPAAQPAAVPVEPFRYSRLSLDNSSAEAEACLYFNKPLAADDVQVRRLPAHLARGEVGDPRGRRQARASAASPTARTTPSPCWPACPAASGAKLEDERKVSLALGPRPAAITLPGKGFILPRGTAAGLPITTVNVGKLGISVYRVNERGLDQFASGRYYYYSSSNFPGTEPVTESWTLRQWLNGENGKRIWRGTMAVEERPEPGDHHRLPDPRDHQGLEARRLLRRGLEFRQAAAPRTTTT